MSQSPEPSRPWLHWPPTRGEWRQALWLLVVFAFTPVVFFVAYMHGGGLLAALAPALKLVGMALVLFFTLTLLMSAWALLVGVLNRL